MHLCTASSIRVIPENEIPPVLQGDTYYVSIYSSTVAHPPHEQADVSSPVKSHTLGGKNSFVGKSSRENISQGLSDDDTQDFSGIQYS